MTNIKFKSDLTSKIGILQVLPEMRAGGVERGTVEIATYVVNQNDFNSYVASSGGPMVKPLVHNKVYHINLNLKSKNPFVILMNIKKLTNIIKKYNIKIIHARSRAPAWSAYFASRKTKIIFLTTFHGIYKQTSKLKKIYNSIMLKGEKVIAVSEFVANHIKNEYNLSANNIVTISRGADLEQFNPNNVSEKRILRLAEKYNIQFDKPLIILPGRITRWKGHVYFIEALMRLPKNSFSALIIGSDHKHKKYRQYLNQLILQNNLARNVAIIDHEPDMAAMYMLADIVVSSSTEPEAFGRVAIEAQAMGKIIIATEIGGSKETIIHEKTGWLVPVKDSNALATTIVKVLDLSAEDRKEISMQAHSHIKNNFSLFSMQSKTYNLYKELLNSLT